MPELEWDIINDICQKQTQKLIDMKYIVLHSSISLNGVSSQFANAIAAYQNQVKKQKEIDIFIETMRKYFPDKVEDFFKLK